MKNLHIIYAKFDNKQVRILKSFGIDVKPEFSRIDIEENDTYWQLKPYLESWHIQDSVFSSFSEIEEEQAKRLLLDSPWANGYPMPDGDRGYLKTTYDASDYCASCGMGLKQKEPFRLKKTPTWNGNKRIFSLNWIFDEFFVRKDFYDEIFKPLGIGYRDVLLFKKETIIEDTVQLVIPTTDSSLILEGYPFEICTSCNRKRYELIRSGFFPPFLQDPGDLHIFKTKEWFGSGGSSRQYVIISQFLRKELLKNKIKAGYYPCASAYT